MAEKKLQADQVNITSSSAELPGQKIIYSEDFIKMSLPDELQAFNSGTGSGFSYLTEYGHQGQLYPGPGTTAGASSGYAYVTWQSCQTTGFCVANGAIRFRAIIKTPAALFDATEDYELILGLNASNFGLSNYAVRILARYGVNGGKWYFEYYTTSAQVTIVANTAGAITADTWYELEFTVADTTHACEFKVNGTSEGTGTPGTKITAGQECGGVWLGIRKHASAGAHPRPKIDYAHWEQTLGRTT